MSLSPNQTKALNEILPIAHIALDPTTRNYPIKPRTHTLMCAPSGTGKSHLMSELGKLAEIPVLHINVSSWQVLGSRGENYTWDSIVEFLKENPKGVIVLEEIDKIDGDSHWQGHLRLELHDLLDGKIPASVDVSDSADLW